MAFRLNTGCVDGDIYRTFIDELRDAVRGSDVEGFIVLHEPDIDYDTRFIEVQLTNMLGQFITVAIDVTNLYVVAYRVGNECWFLDDRDYPPNGAPGSSIFEDIPRRRRHVLNFGGRYEGAHQLQSFAGHRRNIDMGMDMLDEAIGLLSGGDETVDRERARSFIIIIQMISEAVRFRYIEQRVVNSMQIIEGVQYNVLFSPDSHMLELENNWIGLSRQIQRARGGNFPRRIQLQDPHGNTYYVDTVTFSLFSDLAVIKFDNQQDNQHNDL